MSYNGMTTVKFCGLPISEDFKVMNCQVVCLYLSRKRMPANGSAISDLYTTSSLDTDASWFFKLIGGYAHITQNPKFATIDQTDNNRCFTNAEGNNEQKIRAFVEQVKSKNGVDNEGFRFYIVNSQTQELCLNRAMENLIAENIELHEKSRKSRTPDKQYEGEQFRKIASVDVYKTLVEIYQGQPVFEPMDLHHIGESEHIMCPTQAFSLETAFKAKDNGLIMASQMCGNSYVVDGNENSLKFPHFHLVQEVAVDTFNPAAIASMNFPKTKTISDTSVKRNEGNNYLMGKNSAVVRHLENRVVSETIRKESDLKAMGVSNEELLHKLKKSIIDASEEEQFKELTGWKAARLNDFTQMWHSSNRISEPIMVMREWYKSKFFYGDNDPRNDLISRPMKDVKPLDISLSPFGNFLARRMEWTRKPYSCISNHMVCLFMSFARLDAYRREKELHINWLLTGAGNCGKSYALNTISNEMSIEHTFEQYAHETGKANAVCHDQLDCIHLYHEMPDHLMGISGNQMSNTGDYLMKNSLDSCEINTKAFLIDPHTGERTFTVAKSEIIRVVGGCTNEPPQIIPEALLQRFIVIMVHDHNVKDKRKIDFALRGYYGSDEMKERKKEVNQYFRLEQYLYCMVEKLIFCKVLPDIDESVFSIVFRDIEKYCSQKGVDMTLPRNLLRVRKIARIMTILHAIEMVFHTPYSPHYNKPFKYEMMFDLAPYFIITEEIALCAIQLLEDQYFTNIEIEVLSNFARDVAHYPPPPDYQGYNPNAMDDTPQPEWKVENDTFGIPKANYNYLQFKGGLWNLANYLSVRCSSTTKHSAANINMMLHIMAKRKIKCRSYIDHDKMDDKVVPMEILIIQNGAVADRKIYVNRQYIDRILAGEYNNIFKDAMEHTTTTATRTRKIITTKQVKDEFGVLQTMNMQQHPSRVKYQDCESDYGIHRHTFDEDYEGGLVEKFLLDKKLYTSTDDEIDFYLPANYEGFYRHYWGQQDGFISKQYPLDYIVNADAEVQKSKFSTKRRRVGDRKSQSDIFSAMSARA